jgi:hypothetical protein
VRRHFGPPRHGPRAAVFDRRQQQKRRYTNWPPRIDDPHGRKPNDETRRRDVSNLNAGLDTTLMKFACDGNGTGFLWRRIAPVKAAKPRKRRA